MDINYIETIKTELEKILERDEGIDRLKKEDIRMAIGFMSSLYDHPETVRNVMETINEKEIRKLIEDVRTDSKACLDICKSMKTVEDARNARQRYGLEVEVNGTGCFSDELDDLLPEDIEWVRIEVFKHLGYFSYHPVSDAVSFDVYPDGYYDAPVEDVTLDNFEEKLLSWENECTKAALEEMFPDMKFEGKEKVSSVSLLFSEEDLVTPVNLSRYLFSEGVYPSPVASEAIIGHYEAINEALYEKDGKLFTVSGSDSATTTSPVTVEEIVSEFKNWRENEALVSPDAFELLEYAREFDSDIHGKSFYDPIQLENEKPDFETFFKSMQEVYPDVTKSEASAFLKFGAPETDVTCQVSFHDGYFYYNTSSDDDGWTFMGDIRDFLNHTATRICDLLEFGDGEGVSIAAFLARHPDAFMPSLRDSLDKVLNENTYNQDGVSLDYAFPEYNDDSRIRFPGPDKVREPATPSFVELGVWLKENIPEENYVSFRNYVHDFVNEDFNHLDRKALWNASELCKIKADWLENREGEQANLHDATPGDISAFLSKTGNSRFFSERLMNEVLRISDEEAAPMMMSDDGRLFIVSDGYHKRTPEELYEDILLRFDSILSGGMGTLSEEERIEYENYRKEFIDKYAEATVSVNEDAIDALLNLPSSERDPVTVFTTCLKANVSSGLSLLDAGKAAVGTCRNVFDEKQMDKLQLFLSRNIDVLDDKHFNSFFDDIISGRFVPERKISGSVKKRNYEGIDR